MATAGYAFPLLAGPRDEPPRTVGYSLGVATAPHDGHDAQILLAVADRGLYAARRSGVAPIRFLAHGLVRVAVPPRPLPRLANAEGRVASPIL